MAEKTESISTKMEMDTSNYKAGVSELNRQLRVMESGFRASVSSMEDWSKSATGLEARNKTLASAMELQKQKITGLSQVYEEMAADEKTSSKELEEMQIKINKATEELGKMEKELNGNDKALAEMADASNKTGEKVDDLSDKQADATKRAGDFKKGMEDLATGLQNTMKAIAAVAGAVAVVGAALGKLVVDTAGTADGLVELSEKTGLSTTKLQELSYVGKQIGTDSDAVVRSLGRMVASMRTAADGTGETSEAFAKLGVPIRDASGQMRDSREVFFEAIDAMGKMTNAADQEILANTLFGKSFMELNPMIKAGSAELKRMAEEAHTVGAVMSEEDVQSMGDFKDSLDSLQDGLKGTMGTLATAFLPAFQNLASLAGTYLKEFASIVKGSNGDLSKMATGIGKMVSKIATDVAAQGPKMLQAGLGILQGIVNSIVSNLPVLLPAVIKMITSMLTFLVQNLPMIIKAAVQIVVALANGIAQALPALIPAIVEIIPQIVTTLMENLPVLVLAAVQILLALTQGIIASIPILVTTIPPMLTAMYDGIVASLPIILNGAAAIMLALGLGIAKNLAPVVAGAGKTITAFGNGVKDVMSAVNDVGINIVNGVWRGINSQYAKFKRQVMDFFSNIVNSVKDALDINSPSRVFASIGASMVEGLGLGFFREMTALQNKVAAMAGSGFGLNSQVGALSGLTGTGQSTAYTFYAPVVIQGAAGQGIGDMLKAKRF